MDIIGGKKVSSGKNKREREKNIVIIWSGRFML